MPTYRSGVVSDLLSQRKGLQRVTVAMEDGSSARAYALTDLIGTVAKGDEVVCNTTALDLDLGTGGWHFIHWNLSRRELASPGPDHIMKLRYTSLQTDVGTSELEYPSEADRLLGGIGVVACSVHSQMAMVALGFAEAAPGKKLALVMTDGASLPLAMSDLVANLVEKDLLVGSVTAGHAFGGDLEAVTVPSALGLAAHVLEADAIVVSMGPGVVGTRTAMGTTALEVAMVLDSTAARGGKPILCVRASSGDPRERHQGISHHMDSVLSLCATEPLVADRPAIARELPGVELIPIGEVPDPEMLLRNSGLKVTTMGRSYSEDSLFFDAATAAGVAAAQLALT